MISMTRATTGGATFVDDDESPVGGELGQPLAYAVARQDLPSTSALEGPSKDLALLSSTMGGRSRLAASWLNLRFISRSLVPLADFLSGNLKGDGVEGVLVPRGVATHHGCDVCAVTCHRWPPFQVHLSCHLHRTAHQ